MQMKWIWTLLLALSLFGVYHYWGRSPVSAWMNGGLAVITTLGLVRSFRAC